MPMCRTFLGLGNTFGWLLFLTLSVTRVGDSRIQTEVLLGKSLNNLLLYFYAKFTHYI